MFYGTNSTPAFDLLVCLFPLVYGKQWRRWWLGRVALRLALDHWWVVGSRLRVRFGRPLTPKFSCYVGVINKQQTNKQTRK